MAPAVRGDTVTRTLLTSRRPRFPPNMKTPQGQHAVDESMFWPSSTIRSLPPSGGFKGSWEKNGQHLAPILAASFHNLNEYDPRVLDVEAWIEYWAALRPQLFVVSCAGLMAFYPSRLPDHPRSQFLGDRDVFGEYFHAAKKRGMRVSRGSRPTGLTSRFSKRGPPGLSATSGATRSRKRNARGFITPAC